MHRVRTVVTSHTLIGARQFRRRCNLTTLHAQLIGSHGATKSPFSTGKAESFSDSFHRIYSFTKSLFYLSLRELRRPTTTSCQIPDMLAAAEVKSSASSPLLKVEDFRQTDTDTDLRRRRLKGGGENARILLSSEFALPPAGENRRSTVVRGNWQCLTGYVPTRRFDTKKRGGDSTIHCSADTVSLPQKFPVEQFRH